MFNEFVTLFFGAGANPNDFELTFALLFFVLMIHTFSAFISRLFKAVR